MPIEYGRDSLGAVRPPDTHSASGMSNNQVQRPSKLLDPGLCLTLRPMNYAVVYEMYKAALKNREEYLAIWPESKDAEAVFLSIVDLEEKTSNWNAAVKQLEEYEKKYGKEVNKFLTAEGRISGIWETKKKDAKAARKHSI